MKEGMVNNLEVWEAWFMKRSKAWAISAFHSVHMVTLCKVTLEIGGMGGSPNSQTSLDGTSNSLQTQGLFPAIL